MQLKDIRKKNGYSQLQLAQELEVSQQALSTWESGKKPLPKPARSKIALLFDVSPSEIETPYTDPYDEQERIPGIKSLEAADSVYSGAVRDIALSLNGLLANMFLLSELPKSMFSKERAASMVSSIIDALSDFVATSQSTGKHADSYNLQNLETDIERIKTMCNQFIEYLLDNTLHIFSAASEELSEENKTQLENLILFVNQYKPEGALQLRKAVEKAINNPSE